MKERKCSQLYFLFGATSVLEQLTGPLPYLMSSTAISSFLPEKGERGWPAEALLPQSGTHVHHGPSQLGAGLGIVFKCDSSTDEVVSLSSPLHRPEGDGRTLGFGGKRNLQKIIIVIIIIATNVKVMAKYCTHLYDVILVPSV